MTHDWSHLDDALDAHLREEAEKPKYDAPYVSGDSVDDTCLDGWFDLGGMRKAILSAITPSDLSALIAEKCPEFVCVTKSPPSSWSWQQQVKFDRATTGAIEAYYPHKQADYAIAQRLELVRQVLQSALDAAPKLGEDN